MQKNEFVITQADNRSKANNVSVFALADEEKISRPLITESLIRPHSTLIVLFNDQSALVNWLLYWIHDFLCSPVRVVATLGNTLFASSFKSTRNIALFSLGFHLPFASFFSIKKRMTSLRDFPFVFGKRKCELMDNKNFDHITKLCCRLIV